MTDTPADPIAAEAREIAARVLTEHFEAELNRSLSDPIGARTRLTDRMAAAFGHRMKAAGRAEASAWRPITEASKDGTHILACDAHRPYDAAWTFDQRPPTVIHWFDGGEFEGWYTSVNELEPRSTFPATHFMPLPSAPEGGDA